MLQTANPDQPDTPFARQSSARLEDRYAAALYELARDAGTIDATAAILSALQNAITGSPDFARALRNPVLGRDGQANALAAIATKLDGDKLVQNFLRLLARKGRQSYLPQIIARYHAIVASARGELTAMIRTAAPLSDAQQQNLIRELSAKHKATIALDIIIDPTLLGGFSARIGTKLYDRTLSGQLNRLMLQLKEAA